MIRPYFKQDGITIYHGDCREVMAEFSASSIDSIITDPPYHLTQVSRGGSPRLNDPATPFGRTRLGERGFMGQTWDGGDVAFTAELWAAVLRVAKPGAMLLSFGGTRTYHRLATAIEEAGFELRDCLSWLYGTGFPKSLDISKALDKSPASEHAKTWSGWGTALKPAWEPILLAMKPLDGTFAENARAHGVAGLSIDAGRIPGVVPITTQGASSQIYGGGKGLCPKGKQESTPSEAGRWPANLLLDEEAAKALDAQSGERKSGSRRAGVRKGLGCHGAYGDGGPAIEGSAGGASRFFYVAKASKAERGKLNNHPTVKPLALLGYLCRLTATPAGGTILDPFLGSGTTLLAARMAGRPAIGVELDEKYCEIAARRLMELAR